MAYVLKSAYAFYNRQYQARPILTICTTNALLAGISDTLTQKYLAPSVSTSTSTSTSASASSTNNIADPTTTSSSASSTSDITALIKESLRHAHERGKEATLELAKDIELSWHEPQEKGGVGSMQDKIRADVERAVGQAYVDAGQEMIQKSKQASNHDVIPDSTVISIEATTSLDYSRMGRFMLYNFSVAPLIHTWYSVLDKNFPLVANNAGTSSNFPTKTITAQSSRLAQSMAPALKRMVADQALFAPVGLALLFSGLTVLEGGSFQDIKDKLGNTYLQTLKANYMVWPLVQLVNFSVVGIAWNAYLSLANSRGNKSDRQQQSEPDEQRPTLAIAS
ncbi:hypothetical protein BGX26_012145 [Mortierella sp. AD094]|nr:hypothetical protein BGX26_012145 [Mortierella sp. AD094]